MMSSILRNATVTARSSNAKLGRMPAISRPIEASCPVTCPFRNNGCYGETRIAGVTRKYASDITLEDAVARLRHRDPSASIMRAGVIGDIVLGGPSTAAEDIPNNIDWDYLTAVVELGRETGLLPFGYTHAWPYVDPTALPGPLVLNASTETRTAAAEAIERGWPTVIASDSVGSRERIAGKRAIICPYVTCGVQCIDCGLCARADRPTIVVLPLHGSTVRKARAAVAERERMVER